MLVGLQEVDVPQDFVLLRPIDGEDILVAHLAEIALRVGRHQRLSGQIFHHFLREVVGQQAPEVEDVRLYLAHKVEREGVSLREHALRPVVGIIAIDVFKVNRRGTGHNVHRHSLAPQVFHDRHISLAHRRQQGVVDVREAVHRLREVEGRAARHVSRALRRNYLVVSNMSYTTKFVFHSYYKLLGRKCTKKRGKTRHLPLLVCHPPRPCPPPGLSPNPLPLSLRRVFSSFRRNKLETLGI